MAYINTQFPVNISYGSSGGPEYSTLVESIKSGFESRNQNWVYSRYKYDVGYGVRTSEDLEAMSAFFHEMRGRLNSFRYKDWADYTAVTQGAIGKVVAVGTTLYLAKVYGTTNTYTRIITKPVTGTILIDGGTDFTLNYETGVVTGNVAADDLWTGEFDVPVRFDQDELPTSLEAFESGSVDVALIEVRQ